MKSSIIYVFKIIITLIVTGILWMLIIGHLNTNPDTIGDKTPFRTVLWQNASIAYTETYGRESDNNGKGFATRTETTWNNSPSTAVTIDLRTM